MSYDYQRSATRIKAVEVNNNTSDIILPVDSMTVRAEPFVPEGGTLQRNYDGGGWFESPTFRLTLELNWAYERTDARPTIFNTLQDLVAEYMNGYLYDFYVKYDKASDSYDSNYYCPRMIPDLQDDNAGIVFSERAREKERNITLESDSSTLSWSQVSFTHD